MLTLCRSVTTITRNRIDPHQTAFVGKCSEYLQLIKFWPSCVPGKGVCGGGEIFGSGLLQPARSVCVSLSAFSFLSSNDLHDLVQCNRLKKVKWEIITEVDVS